MPYDGFFNLALVLKVASYLPPLVGLFAESVILYRAQKRLTGELQVAQAELREYSKDLERKVSERTSALETRAGVGQSDSGHRTRRTPSHLR